ncbi:hypothetical protein [Sphingomicrobium sediminis]|uniref:Uncharacterized protein n=1 Tax=Sphingomicrobium sediminis TaxID=2950949 RepID=A0A9X2J1Y4_9SPHN|nr:hypothetical protein [Sphingomicrobium sediminis]MCM8557229.1 hypothetical protein [Sphingomicrobium sediminis]
MPGSDATLRKVELKMSASGANQAVVKIDGWMRVMANGDTYQFDVEEGYCFDLELVCLGNAGAKATLKYKALKTKLKTKSCSTGKADSSLSVSVKNNESVAYGLVAIKVA